MDASIPTDFNLLLYHKPVLHIDREDDWLCLEIMKEIWDTVYYCKPQCTVYVTFYILQTVGFHQCIFCYFMIVQSMIVIVIIVMSVLSKSSSQCGL